MKIQEKVIVSLLLFVFFNQYSVFFFLDAASSMKCHWKKECISFM